MIEDMGDVSHSVGIENWFIIAARGRSYNWVLTVIEPLVTLVNSSDFDHKGYSSYYQFVHSVGNDFMDLFRQCSKIDPVIICGNRAKKERNVIFGMEDPIAVNQTWWVTRWKKAIKTSWAE